MAVTLLISIGVTFTRRAPEERSCADLNSMIWQQEGRRGSTHNIGVGEGAQLRVDVDLELVVKVGFKLVRILDVCKRERVSTSAHGPSSAIRTRDVQFEPASLYRRQLLKMSRASCTNWSSVSYVLASSLVSIVARSAAGKSERSARTKGSWRPLAVDWTHPSVL